MLEGILVVNKPRGMTSHDVVSIVRKKFNMRAVGHAGTLDPIATGVLVVLVGKSTKLFNEFVAFDKAYSSTLLLGTVTRSADIQGEIIKQSPYSRITEEDVEQAFSQFRGDIEQVPPMVSAVKVGGQRLYKLARKGIVVDRPARKIRVDELKILEFNSPEVRFYLECSKGTYVRKIAEDVGEVLGCGACITQIERTKVGPLAIENAVALDQVGPGHLVDWSTVKAS